MSKTSSRKAERILAYGFTLKRMFPGATLGPVEIYKRLHRLEAEAHTFAERCCNEDISDKRIAAKDASLLRRVRKALGEVGPVNEVFVNADPRGYALKIKPSAAGELDRDWGGYGILCPEL